MKKKTNTLTKITEPRQERKPKLGAEGRRGDCSGHPRCQTQHDTQHPRTRALQQRTAPCAEEEGQRGRPTYETNRHRHRHPCCHVTPRHATPRHVPWWIVPSLESYVGISRTNTRLRVTTAHEKTTIPWPAVQNKSSAILNSPWQRFIETPRLETPRRVRMIHDKHQHNKHHQGGGHKQANAHCSPSTPTAT